MFCSRRTKYSALLLIIVVVLISAVSLEARRGFGFGGRRSSIFSRWSSRRPIHRLPSVYRPPSPPRHSVSYTPPVARTPHISAPPRTLSSSKKLILSEGGGKSRPATPVNNPKPQVSSPVRPSAPVDDSVTKVTAQKQNSATNYPSWANPSAKPHPPTPSKPHSPKPDGAPHPSAPVNPFSPNSAKPQGPTSHQPIKPSHEPPKSSHQPIKPSHEPPKSSHEPIKPSHEPIKPSHEPIKPFHEPVKPIKPSHEQIKPSHEPIKPSHEPIKPSHEPIKPSHEPVKPIKPSHEQIKPSHEPIKPSHEPIKPSHEPIKPSHEPIKPTHDSHQNSAAPNGMPYQPTPSNLGGHPQGMPNAHPIGFENGAQTGGSNHPIGSPHHHPFGNSPMQHHGDGPHPQATVINNHYHGSASPNVGPQNPAGPPSGQPFVPQSSGNGLGQIFKEALVSSSVDAAVKLLANELSHSHHNSHGPPPFGESGDHNQHGSPNPENGGTPVFTPGVNANVPAGGEGGSHVPVGDGIGTPSSGVPASGVQYATPEQTGSPQPNAEQTGSPQPNAKQTGSPQPNAEQTGSPQPNAKQTGSPQPNAEQTGSPQPNSGQTGSPQPNSGQTGSPQPNSDQTGSPQPNSGQTGSPQPNAEQTGSPQPNAAPSNGTGGQTTPTADPAQESQYFISNDELGNLTEKLFAKEATDANNHIKLNLQNRSSDPNVTDQADGPLLYVSQDAYRIPTIQAFRNLFDNYEFDSEKKESADIEKREEENVMLDAFLDTDIMSTAMQWLADKGYIESDKFEWKDTLRRIWMSKMNEVTSGFERVFLAERYPGPGILGGQNWIYFDHQETLKLIKYLSYVDKINLGDKASLLKVNFKIDDAMKPNTTMLVGTPPELEMALYTICYYTRPNELCSVSLGGTRFTVYTHAFDYFGKYPIDLGYMFF